MYGTFFPKDTLKMQLVVRNFSKRDSYCRSIEYFLEFALRYLSDMKNLFWLRDALNIRICITEDDRMDGQCHSEFS